MKTKSSKSQIVSHAHNVQKFVVKKKKILHQKLIQKNLCSTKIFSLFLKRKESFSFDILSIASKIYEKISKNVVQFNQNVDFQKLKNAGFYEPVFLLKMPTLLSRFEKICLAIELVKAQVSFNPIFVLKKDETLAYPKIVLSDFNLKLFQELSKINLNYDPSFNKKLLLPKEDIFGEIENVKRIFCFENENISYSFSSRKTGKVFVFLKIESEIFNIKRFENSFIIEKVNSKINYVSNKKIFDIQRTKVNFQNYIVVVFNTEKNCQIQLVCEKNITNFGNLILKEKIEFLKIYPIKIYTKNSNFNEFFNVFLRREIVKNLRQKNYLNVEKTNFNFSEIANFLEVDEKELDKQPCKIYEFIIGNVFGIKVEGAKIFVLKAKKFEYKINFFYNGEKHIYVKTDGKNELCFGNVIFSNTNCVDVSLLSSTAKLCL